MTEYKIKTSNYNQEYIQSEHKREFISLLWAYSIYFYSFYFDHMVLGTKELIRQVL
jgi:hypothetical protein